MKRIHPIKYVGSEILYKPTNKLPSREQHRLNSILDQFFLHRLIDHLIEISFPFHTFTSTYKHILQWNILIC